MKLHHIGIACARIDEGLLHLRSIYTITHVSGVVYDPLQDASVCLVSTAHGMNFELIAGARVTGLLRKGMHYYHLCFEVENLEEEAKRLVTAGAMPITEAKPALLFGGRKVHFFMTRTGMIELLEEEPT